MNAKSFPIDVIFVADAPLLSARIDDLVSITSDITNELVEEQVDCNIHVLSGDVESRFETIMKRNDRRAAIVISDRVVNGEPPQTTPLAARLAEMSAAAHVSLAIVGLSKAPPEVLYNCRLPGIHWLMQGRPEGMVKSLHDAIVSLMPRLWYHTPPEHAQKAPPLEEAIVIDDVRSKEEFLAAVKLRFNVYDALDYLLEDVRSSTMRIEMDRFDMGARHLIAWDRSRNRIAGCVRLVMPPCAQDQWRDRDQYLGAPVEVGKWIRELMDGERSRVFHELMQPRPQPLPASSMKAFSKLQQELGVTRVQEICELSRLIVAPGYRGRGLSKRLIECAVNLATYCNRKVMFIECASNHQPFYSACGFTTPDCCSRQAEACRDLRALALTMYKRLGTRAGITTPRRNMQLGARLVGRSEEETEKLRCGLHEQIPLEIRLCGGEEEEAKSRVPDYVVDLAHTIIPLSVQNRGHVEVLAQLIHRTLLTLREHDHSPNMTVTNGRSTSSVFTTQHAATEVEEALLNLLS